MAENTQTKEDSRAQFPDTPKGQQERWTMEMEASEKLMEKFYEQGDKVLEKYLDKRGNREEGISRLNLFHSGVDTVRSMLYGQVPKIDFDRRYADPNDDVARVGSEMLERMLNADIERPDDDYTAVLRYCLDDRLLPGLGQARVRYEAEFKEEEVPAIVDPYSGTVLAESYLRNTLDFEQSCIDYVHWKDFRYSYARTWSEVRWVAFRSWLDYDRLKQRFGEKKAKKVPLKSQYPFESDRDIQDAWQKGEIWEIWDKETKRVCWWSEGMDEILETRPDTLRLKSFFPCPRPLLANATTSLLIPKADYTFAQDQYTTIDELTQRIEVLIKAVRVVGVYDKENPEIKRVLTEACENDMIPVDNWAMFAEKKGLDGAVSWFPLEQVVETLDKLRELRSEQIALLYQVTGLSDIMRGQAEGSDRVSATEQSIKAKFASVRVQAMQDEFSRFGTDLMRLKAEVVAKHFQPETIIGASNIALTPDAPLAEQAVQLIQNEESFVWRIQVRPESMAMVDYQALQAERTGFLSAVATFLQSSAPIVETMPGSTPMLMELLQWGLSGFKGSNQIEGVMDRAIQQAQREAQKPKPPDPEQVKMQMEQQRTQAEFQMEQQKVKMEMALQQMQMQIEQQEARLKMMLDQQKHAQEMRQDREKHRQEMQQTAAAGQLQLEIKERESEQKELDRKSKSSV